MQSAPPGFLRLAGHPVRWRLLTELARTDRQVRELTGLLGQPQSLVSYHLGQLRAGGLVSARRSSADGRDSYYRIDLARCRELLAETGLALHPVSGSGPGSGPGSGCAPGADPGAVPLHREQRPVADGRGAARADGRAARSTAASAGSRPKPLHPEAVRVMREHGIDISGRRSKHLEEFAGQQFGYVITLCDRVREVCPEFPGHPRLIHWSIADPAGEADPRAAFRRVAAELRTRIGFLLARLGE